MRRWAILMMLGTMLAAATPAMADDDDREYGHGGHDHHDDIRRSVLAGKILPLSTILERLDRDHGGELIEAEIETHHGQPVYEIKMVSREGRLLKLYVDARDGTILKTRERR